MPKAKTRAEKWYIWKRKINAYVNRLCFYLCRLFPIKKNLISVCAFEGKNGFVCNPKYIVQELHRQDPHIKFVWFVNKDIFNQKIFPNYVKKVPNTIWNRAYWLSRSMVWIDNYRKSYGTVKRKGQYYINTWHGNMGFKPIGLWRGDKFSQMAYLVSLNDSKMIDDVVIESDYVRYIFRKGLIYDGHFLETGQPRCDILYTDNPEEKQRVRKKYGLPLEANIIMFAPTFRETSDQGKRNVLASVSSLDYQKVIDIFEEKFGGEWYLCLRLHPQVVYELKEVDITAISEKIINVSDEEDMYELLSVMDAFITDYSSAAFDASYKGIPVILYIDDLDEYSADRGQLMWNLKDEGEIHNNHDMIAEYDLVLPYPVARNNDDLKRVISEFDMDEYLSKLNIMNKEINLHFDGKASQRVAEIIRKRMSL